MCKAADNHMYQNHMIMKIGWNNRWPNSRMWVISKKCWNNRWSRSFSGCLRTISLSTINIWGWNGVMKRLSWNKYLPARINHSWSLITNRQPGCTITRSATLSPIRCHTRKISSLLCVSTFYAKNGSYCTPLASSVCHWRSCCCLNALSPCSSLIPSSRVVWENPMQITWKHPWVLLWVCGDKENCRNWNFQ
jgi:hypothetical protein